MSDSPGRQHYGLTLGVLLVAAKRRAVFDSLSDDDRPAAAALLRHLAEAIEDGR